MPNDSPLLLLWSESAFVSAMVWALISILLLYLARGPAHDMLERVCLTLAAMLRFAAAGLLRYSRRTAGRNREILRVLAEDEYARRIERQFRWIGERVDRDLGAYPALHRALREQIGRIEADHREAADTPPAPPSWLAAIEAIAALEARSEPAIARILRDMHVTLEAACHDAVQEYRIDNRHRHRLLRRLQPYVRRLAATLELLQRRLEGVTAAARTVDSHMASYQTLRAQRRGSIRRLGIELLTRALGGGALLAIAGLAAALNYRLIAAPLNALLDTASDGWIPAATLMLIELALGVWIAEAAGLTRMLSLFGQLGDDLRRRLIWLGGGVLVVLAVLQAGLAWVAYAAVAGSPLSAASWLAPAMAASLALLLPVVLALAAVPLEAVIRSAPALLGGLLAGTARLAAATARVAALAIAALPAPARKVYDVWIFLPLWCEQAVRDARGPAPASVPPRRSRSGRKR